MINKRDPIEEIRKRTRNVGVVREVMKEMQMRIQTIVRWWFPDQTAVAEEPELWGIGLG